MRNAVILAVLALADCKKYVTPAKIGESCKADADCAEGLDCTLWEGRGRICMKACGPSAFDPDEVVDRTCPPGWRCAGTEMRRVDKAGSDRGAAFMGLADRAMCVPSVR